MSPDKGWLKLSYIANFKLILTLSKCHLESCHIETILGLIRVLDLYFDSLFF